jgi:uncharacterized Zn-finger protein
VEVKDENEDFKENFTQYEELDSVVVEALDEVEMESIIVPLKMMPVKNKRVPRILSEVDNKKKAVKSPQINPEDDAKIQAFANMKCDYCDEVFLTLANAMAHYRSVHNTLGYLRCCDKIFRKRWRLIDHLNNVHFHISYSCDICGKEFGSPMYLKRHKMYHTAERPYVSS